MEQNSAGLDASATAKGLRYARHRSDQTSLYQLVEQYYPEFAGLMDAQGRALPRCVRRPNAHNLKNKPLGIGVKAK
jgi:hypothetical protein